MNQSETTSAAGGGEKPQPWSAFSIDEADSISSDPCVGYSREWAVGYWTKDDPDPLHTITIGSRDRDEHTARQVAKRLNAIWSETAPAALAAPTAKGGTEVPKIVRHIKTGGLYEVLCEFAQVQTGAPLKDYASVAVYRGLTPPHLTWVRPLIEFNDERFEFGPVLTAEESAALASPPPPAGAAGGGSGDLGALSAEAREAVLAVVRTAWALVDNTGHHDLLPLAINRDDWDELAARLTALKALLPAEELPADPPHAVAYFWPAEATPVLSPPTPDLGAQGEPAARGEIAKWRDDALEKAAEIARRYGDPCTDDVVRDILALRSVGPRAVRERHSKVTLNPALELGVGDASCLGQQHSPTLRSPVTPQAKAQGDLVSRSDVLAICDQIAATAVEYIFSGAEPDHNPRREAMEATATGIRHAVANLTAAVPKSVSQDKTTTRSFARTAAQDEMYRTSQERAKKCSKCKRDGWCMNFHARHACPVKSPWPEDN